jgi:hypothetical protein
MTTRDERLLSLKEAVEEWGEREEERLEDEVAFLETVRDRVDSGQLATANTAAASQLLQDEIDEFLEE